MLSLLLATEASAGRWRAAVGGELNADPHGVFDLGHRSGPWSAELLTDTLDLRWAPTSERGRAWLAARGELGAAGLMTSPWTDGAPDPDRAVAAFYAGGEGGALRYLPRGAYLGGQASARRYWFRALADDAPDPASTLLVSADLLLGWWSEDASAWLRAGADVQPGTLSPHLAGELRGRAPWPVAPTAELRAGIASDQDEVTLTRLGGSNPYVVPLAGAAWAEWWVEDYVALRAGPSWRGERVEAALVADLARFDDEQAAGFAGRGRIGEGRFFGEAELGLAPWIERQPGIARVGAWLRVGVTHGEG